MIKLNDVTFAYRFRKNVVENFNLKINNGERIALSGASGKGKTTILRLLLSLEKPKKGSIEIPANTRFSVVFQEDRLIDHKTVLENVALFSDQNTARDILVRLGLGEFLDMLPSSLSGGMKRRVALARALAHPFDVLILDEAFSGLDKQNLENSIQTVLDILGDKTLIMVTHNLKEAEMLKARQIAV